MPRTDPKMSQPTQHNTGIPMTIPAMVAITTTVLPAARPGFQDGPCGGGCVTPKSLTAPGA